jgi:hypothetical protein
MTRMVNTMGLTSELSTAEKYMHQSSNQGSRKHRRSPRQMDKHDRTLHRTKKKTLRLNPIEVFIVEVIVTMVVVH